MWSERGAAPHLVYIWCNIRYDQIKIEILQTPWYVVHKLINSLDTCKIASNNFFLLKLFKKMSDIYFRTFRDFIDLLWFWLLYFWRNLRVPSNYNPNIFHFPSSRNIARCCECMITINNTHEFASNNFFLTFSYIFFEIFFKRSKSNIIFLI